MRKVVIKFIIVIFLAIFTLNTVNAAMTSENYVIYENVNHVFDGPVISGVSDSVSGIEATVSWNTNVTADSFVIYDTDSGFGSSKEQGSSNKSGTSHSVVVSGLNENTTYYYRVRSERINGGLTTDVTSRTFMTGVDPSTVTPPTPSGGGGILVVDKTDKVPPEISNIIVSVLSANNTLISWETNEDATGFVEYGLARDYGSTYGQWSTSTEHAVELENLDPNSLYHFRLLSSDGWGNVSYSDDQIFTTIPGGGEEEILPKDIPDEIEPGIIDTFGEQAIEFITRLFPFAAINDLPGIGTIEDLIGRTPAPNLSAEPRVEVSATKATIRWDTDVEANSLVALAPEHVYDSAKAEPYQQIIGNPEIYSTEHEVTLYGLTPDTTFHFQLRSQAPFGRMSTSRDYTFRTSIEELQITSYFMQIVDNETAIFKWVTNKAADSAVKFTPYFNNVLALDQSKTIRDNAQSVVHEIKVSEFVAGTYYDVEIVSADEKGNIASKIFPQFSTTEDDFPPTISHVKADSTIFVDRGDKIQTIISWLTNEPSTSRVYYQEGVHGASVELNESTKLNTNYTKEHVMVITKFKPGIVYSFRVESIDSGANTTMSKAHTFMTAKKRESIIQVILNILENTFGWVKALM